MSYPSSLNALLLGNYVESVEYEFVLTLSIQLHPRRVPAQISVPVQVAIPAYDMAVSIGVRIIDMDMTAP